MPLLIQMRQHIKAIESIRKITHAMRLVAMSGHSKFKTKEKWVTSYTHQTHELFDTLNALAQIPGRYLGAPTSPQEPRSLFIVVGSQKGFCGNFNTALFVLLENHLRDTESADIITIGSKATEFLTTSPHAKQIIKQFNTFNATTIKHIVGKLTRHLLKSYQNYDRVVLYSNRLKTFFIQQPTITTLLPFAQPEQSRKTQGYEEYVWEQPPHDLLRTAAQLQLEADVYKLLFHSLFAEQAARFLSMDNATRNAEKMLDTIRLRYNKLRQAKITKEITELASIDLT